MVTPLFTSIPRTPRLINREGELESIRRAIYEAEAGSCQIILLQAPGGLGKSRLAEEVLWRGGNPLLREALGEIPAELDWGSRYPGQAVFADLLDMANPGYHARLNFIQGVRDALVWAGSPVSFPKYDATYNRLQTQRQWMGDPRYIESLAREAEKYFLEELKENARRQRLVIVLDTVERLSPIGGTQWLIDRGLLSREDLQFHTYYWFLERLERGDFANLTFILAGRCNEPSGERFFADVTSAAAQNPACRVSSLKLEPFTAEETRQFLQTLADSWEGKGKKELATDLRHIAEQLSETLHTYTGGQPVRLALYTDLLLQSISLPEELFSPPPSGQDLEDIQRKVESRFIRLLFSPRGGRRSEILRVLIQTPRGLDAEQLAFLLSDDSDPEAWLKSSQAAKLREEIEEELKELAHLSLVKKRPDGRLGLQDEIYRIYARHISQEEKWREEERQSRKARYEKLEAWARYQYREQMKELSMLREIEESRIPITVPSRVYRDVHFPVLTENERLHRTNIYNALHRWEFEALHYALLADPVTNLNLRVFELADQKWLALDPDFELLIQAELWQILENPTFALEEFGTFRDWPALKSRKESALSALKRVSQQEDVTYWLKRFALKEEYKKTLEFYERLEAKLRQDYPPDSEEPAERSWHHSLTRLQRALWRDYARIFLGEGLEGVVNEMEENVKRLEILASHGQDELLENGEYGFIDHPAETKIKRVIGLYHNYIAYGYAQLGRNRKAREHYNRAIQIFRQIDSKELLSNAMNNLSRVLSESGYHRARRVCLDGLKLRRELGADVPLAYSYNTLALIDNDHYRPDLAWVEAAIATAYFRRAEENRGLGLALLQLGEALRRLARSAERFHLRGDDPERILETAIQVLDEAVNLFTEREEKIRLVEAWIERGCLERDRISLASDKERKRRHYNEALNYLSQAVKKARELKNLRLELDARVNIAWTHYYYGDMNAAEQVLKEAIESIPKEAQFAEGSAPPAERDDLYLYQQLSKIYGLKGRIRFKRFIELTEAFKESHPEQSKEERQKALARDKKVQHELEGAAEAYTLAIGYAFLLSPTSSALDVTYDALYEFVKGLNRFEMDRFNEYCLKFRRVYRLEHLSGTSPVYIDRFLEESFGLSKESANAPTFS
ncbi:MAG: ATP-binding protein [Chloroflexi bacterium]|nr:ATP-binding protein [Chloroflexota bacterium]